MFITLMASEMIGVVGGSRWICDAGDILKKGVQAGGLAYCLSMKRGGLIGEGMIANADSRRAVTKGICSTLITLFVGFGSYGTKRGAEYFGLDCSGCDDKQKDK